MRKFEPEEVRRARTTGGTVHIASQGLKLAGRNIQPGGTTKKKVNPAIKNKSPAPTICFLFVDQTKGGVVAKRLQEAEDRLSDLT